MDDGRDGGGAAFEACVSGRRGGRRGLAEGTVDGDGAAKAVEPLLLVEDVIDLQCVGLRLARVLGANTEYVLGCRQKRKG